MILQPIFVALLLLQLASIHVTGEICPHPEDISPCECRYVGSSSDINVFCVGGDVFDVATAFSEFEGKTIEKVELRKVRNGRLPSHLFWKVKVKELQILDCELQGIADTDRRPAFVGLENSLVRLTIHNSITGANKLASANLAHLKSLKDLKFSKNNIPEVGDEWFENGPDNLDDLIFESCNISKLGNNAFAHLNLRYLRIFKCPIRYFKRTMLPRPAQRLYQLSLRYDDLASPPEDFLEEMDELIYLYLEGNRIRRLQSKPFASVWKNLDYLNLDDNPLQCDSHMDWLVNLKPPEKLHGRCGDPVNKTLRSFIESSKKPSFQNIFKIVNSL